MRNSPLAAELRDAITPRAFLLMTGVLLVQLAFVFSYVGAFHDPDPRGVPLAVVAPDGTADRTARRLGTLPGDPVDTTVVPDRAEARKRILEREVQGAYVVRPRGRQDVLLVASGAGGSVTSALTRIGRNFAEQQDRTLRVEDVAPAADGDEGSLTAFYLVVGWMVGGYLAAAMLGVTAGSRPLNTRRAAFRLAAMAVYAAVSGLGGALIVGPALDALPGHVLALWGVGALVVFTAGAVTVALQALFGVLGIGLAILLFVVLGNPSAGGAYQAHLVPEFWGAIGSWLPTGAGVTTVRNTVYFSGNALTAPMALLGGWALVGIVATLAVCAFVRHRPAPARSVTSQPPGGTIGR